MVHFYSSTGVCVPDDREGNARLMASIVECLPRTARATLVYLLDHLALVVAAQDRNKMSPQHLAVAMAPPLMLHSQPPNELDYQRAIHVLQCMLQIWPAPKRTGSGNVVFLNYRLSSLIFISFLIVFFLVQASPALMFDIIFGVGC